MTFNMYSPKYEKDYSSGNSSIHSMLKALSRNGLKFISALFAIVDS